MLEEAGREGRLVLLLDGLDEVPREDRVDAESLLKDLSGRWPRAPIIVSSRPIGYRRPAHDYRELEVQPFDSERRREFLRRWFGRIEAKKAAREIAEEEDLSRWAEPYALLAGRVDDPDALVISLVEANRALGLRALATAQGLEDETLDRILELSEDPEERATVYQRIPELIDEPSRALALVDRLRSRTRNGDDLFFLERSVEAMVEKWPAGQNAAEELQARFYDHIPKPPEELFRRIETKDGRSELWCEIPAGRFPMGSAKSEEGSYKRPQHVVVVRSPFRMAAVPVTVEQYAAFDPEHRSYHQSEVPKDRISAHPVEMVSWYAASAFCRWLSSRLPIARGARLPNEEEWEYVCRAGTVTRYWNGENDEDLAAIGWYRANSSARNHRVGRKPANAWGLYDVHGNVWEWTQSERQAGKSGRDGRVEVDPSTIGLVTATGGIRVFRGGGFANSTHATTAAYRLLKKPQHRSKYIGLRVLLPASRGSRE